MTTGYDAFGEPKDIRWYMDQPKPKEKDETCAAHGPYRAANVSLSGVAWTRCPKCEVDHRQKAGEVYAAQEELRVQRWRREQEITFRATGLPKRFQDYPIEAFQVELEQPHAEAQRTAFDFAKSFACFFDLTLQHGRSALFVGSTGTGKTMLACGIANYVRSKGCSVRYATVQGLVQRVKESWLPSGERVEGKTPLRDISECDLLILDEVGVQHGTEFERNLLFGILNERYNNLRPYLLISNLTAEGAAEYLGERVIGRMREDGGTVITFAWPSYRDKPKSNEEDT
jgi:DNA replication protein DnaC